MALFEFELSDAAGIPPWETSKGPDLSWFALTHGSFRMPVGEQVLFEYSDEIMAHWATTAREADYQVAAFVRDILGSVSAAVARLPERIERLAADWDRLSALERTVENSQEREERHVLAYAAFRWLGERSPWTSYLTANPNFHFVRIGDDLRIHWDNRARLVDGVSVWTARVGVHTVAVEAFVEECRELARRLLEAMARRIDAIEAGTVRTQAPVNVPSLRTQHDAWQAEFASYFEEHQPDVPWPDAERALERLSTRRGIPF